MALKSGATGFEGFIHSSKQGVSITHHSDLFYDAVNRVSRVDQASNVTRELRISFRTTPIIHDSDLVVFLPSGSVVPNKHIFDDSFTPENRISAFDGAVGTTVINLQRPQQSVGDIPIYEDALPFVDEPSPDISFNDPVEYITRQAPDINAFMEKYGSGVRELKFKSIQRIGQLDGVTAVTTHHRAIDMLPTRLRDPDGNFVTASYKHENALADYECSSTAGRTITQYRVFGDPSIRSFNDSPFDDSFYAIDRQQTADNVTPFDDADGYIETVKYDNVYSARGTGLTVDGGVPTSQMVIALLDMTSSLNGMNLTLDFPDATYSSGAGFTYAISNLTGANVGTDSITYGGLKK